MKNYISIFTTNNRPPATFSALLFSAFLTLLAAFSPVYAQEPVSKSFWGDVAIGGMDVVAYYTDDVRKSHQAVEGTKAFSVEYLGAKWLFVSQENADKFRATPKQYVPEYNGYCANALSTGNGLVKTDGTNWEFFDDTLYLFYSANGRQNWLDGDWKAAKKLADAAWTDILAKQ